jgi:hypothetical protein
VLRMALSKRPGIDYTNGVPAGVSGNTGNRDSGQSNTPKSSFGVRDRIAHLVGEKTRGQQIRGHFDPTGSRPQPSTMVLWLSTQRTSSDGS